MMSRAEASRPRHSRRREDFPQDDLRIENRTISSLRPYARNARTHSSKQIRQIARSIEEFGFTNPILIDREGGVIAGHGRVKAAELLGHKVVPTICLDHLSETQKRAYVIADNRLAERADWDPALLALELQYLSEIDIDFDVTITGFEVPEIDLLIEDLSPTEDPEADSIPEADTDSPPVSQPGDIWRLGRHRLFCGDALAASSFERLLAGRKAQMVFTDPPYNVAITGHVCGLGAARHDEFPMASGEMSEAEFTTFLQTALRNLADHSCDGSIHFVCMDWRHIYELTTAARNVYSDFKNLCVWNKTNAGMGSLYRSKHELVLVFKSGTAPHINNIELGRHGRHRTNVWDYPGLNTLRPGRLDELQMHPTVKPVALVADAILDCSKRSGIVLDCFAGSGTTLIAAEKTGRTAYAMELDPRHVDTAVRRWQDYTGEAAVHAETGLNFTQTATTGQSIAARQTPNSCRE